MKKLFPWQRFFVNSKTWTWTPCLSRPFPHQAPSMVVAIVLSSGLLAGGANIPQKPRIS